jgi:hypothetical protein
MAQNVVREPLKLPGPSNMTDDFNSIDQRAYSLFEAGKWADARACYETLLSRDMPPLDRVAVLWNIMATHDWQGNRNEAFQVGLRAMEIIESEGLRFASVGGIQLAPQFGAHLIRLSVPFYRSLIAYFAAPLVGAAIGSFIGANLHGPQVFPFTPPPLVPMQVRFELAIFGVLLGLPFVWAFRPSLVFSAIAIALSFATLSSSGTLPVTAIVFLVATIRLAILRSRSRIYPFARKK